MQSRDAIRNPVDISHGRFITKLSKKQESLVPVYFKKWLDAGLRTAPINQVKAREAVDFLYTDIMKLEKPKHVIFLGSPMAIQLACNLIKNTKLSSQLESQLESRLYSQLVSRLSSQLVSRLYSPLESQLDSQLESQLDSQLRSQLDSQLESLLRLQLRSQLRSQLESQLDSQLDSQLVSQLDSQKLSYFNFSFSNWWYWIFCWYGFYDFVLNELFPKKKKEFLLFSKYCKHIKELHYIAAVKEIAFVSDFPKEIHRNSRAQLHNSAGASLLYRDTYALYALNGIRVSKELAEITPDKITKERK